jgi:hypothetical protein
MAGPSSPGSEGPTFAPPPLPAGWIAQWDASSRKYYFVQLSTGASQWETPTEAAPVGGTPSARTDHPYGVPQKTGNNGAEIIVHPDGSQTARYPDGRLEPVHPREDGSVGDGTRGVGGGGGDRSLGVRRLFFSVPYLLAGERFACAIMSRYWPMLTCSICHSRSLEASSAENQAVDPMAAAAAVWLVS